MQAQKKLPPSTLCWINDQLCNPEDAKISVFDHGLLYGDGVFEGIRLYQGQPFLLHAHLNRLMQSAAAIQLALPCNLRELEAKIREMVAHWQYPEGYLRLVITRGEGSLGIDPNRCDKANLVMILGQLQLTPATLGMDVIIAQTRRTPQNSLSPQIKSLNYLNSILAKLEANNAEADDAILLNHQGNVAEASAANVFIYQQNGLHTPPIHDGSLAGVTRDVILKLAVRQNIKTVVKSLTPEELVNADECFFTGTGAELLPVRSIQNQQLKFCPGKIFCALQDAFKQLTQTPSQWVNFENP